MVATSSREFIRFILELASHSLIQDTPGFLVHDLAPAAMARLTASSGGMSLAGFFKLPLEDRQRIENMYPDRPLAATLTPPSGASASWEDSDEQELTRAKLLVTQLKAMKAAALKENQDDIAAAQRLQDAEIKSAAAAAAARKEADDAVNLALLKKRNGKRQTRQVIPKGVQDGRIGKNFVERTTPRSKGLKNKSNLCYRNATLQCLLHTPEFGHLLGNVHKDCPKENHECVTCALQALTATYWNGSQQRIDVYRDELNQAMKTVYPNDIDIQGERQSDPQEWLAEFIRQIVLDTTGLDPNLDDAAYGKLIGNYNFRDMFRFEYDAQFTCVKCQRINKNEAYPSLGLAITMRTGFTGTIEEHMRDPLASPFLNEAPLSCANTACTGSRRRASARPIQTSQRYITRAPEVLILTLYRFASSTGKVLGSAPYGEILDLTEFTANGSELSYQLNGVVSHSGQSLDSGHYIANVINQDDPSAQHRYSTLDDSNVTSRSDPGRLLKPDKGEVYILIYSKQ